MATPEFKHGMGGRAVAGSTTLNVEEWSVDPTIDIEAFMHMEGDGFKNKLVGGKDLSGSLVMTWDAANPPTASPPNLTLGAEIALKLYVVKGGAVYWNIPKAIIKSTPMRANAETRITFEAQFESNGTFNIVGT